VQVALLDEVLHLLEQVALEEVEVGILHLAQLLQLVAVAVVLVMAVINHHGMVSLVVQVVVLEEEKVLLEQQ
jgi:hypothetical protein